MGVLDSDDELSRLEALEKQVITDDTAEEKQRSCRCVEDLRADLETVRKKVNTRTVDASTVSRQDELFAGLLPSDVINAKIHRLLQEKESRDSRMFAAAEEVRRLWNILNGKVSWSDFQNGLRRIDEMRVFLETAAEKVFIGHRQFVLDELDKKADVEAVNWGLRAKADEAEVKALRARVEYLERIQGALLREVECIRPTVDYVAANTVPAVLKNTAVCKIMWDLLGLSDPSAKLLVNPSDTPAEPGNSLETPRAPPRREAAGRAVREEQSCASASAEAKEPEGTLPAREPTTPQIVNTSSGTCDKRHTVSPPSSLVSPNVDLTPRLGEPWSARRRCRAPPAPRTLAEPPPRGSRVASSGHPAEVRQCHADQAAGSRGTSVDSEENDAPQESSYEPGACRRRRPAGRTQRQRAYSPSSAPLEPSNQRENKAQLSSPPRATRVAAKKAAELKTTVRPASPGQWAMRATLIGITRESRRAREQVLAATIRLAEISEMLEQMYIEYCLELVEEKFKAAEEKLGILTAFADSVNAKRRSDEERRLASLDWTVKEVLKVRGLLSDCGVTGRHSMSIQAVLRSGCVRSHAAAQPEVEKHAIRSDRFTLFGRLAGCWPSQPGEAPDAARPTPCLASPGAVRVLQRLTFCSSFPLSPRAYHVDQGVNVKDVAGTPLPGVHNTASPDDSANGGAHSPQPTRGLPPAGSPRPNVGKWRHSGRGDDDSSKTYTLKDAFRDIFAWTPKEFPSLVAGKMSTKLHSTDGVETKTLRSGGETPFTVSSPPEIPAKAFSAASITIPPRAGVSKLASWSPSEALRTRSLTLPEITNCCRMHP
ncbi:hypothetical protein BESB_015320 [Besnoitia besnoiti]|uniref:Uncharacterized protein n=1 Tax=Besnoitia besnoiti TaxID=94643 RepID=A0A2A9M4P3_BESBE|nr:hypothetical protein BESB_015320 [Besnoitia besnoiti]PFH32919.1 hypothetical protein BESB_015320 [Besnoitia besnoiti]